VCKWEILGTAWLVDASEHHMWYMFDIKEFCILPTQCIYALPMNPITSIQH